MNSCQYILLKAGVDEYFCMHVPDDLESLWRSWDDAVAMVELLTGAGYSYEELVRPVRAVLDVVSMPSIELELRWGTPMAVRNAVCLLVRDCMPHEPFVDAYKALFPLSDVAARLMEKFT